MSQERRKFDKEFKVMAVELSKTRENIQELAKMLYPLQRYILWPQLRRVLVYFVYYLFITAGVIACTVLSQQVLGCPVLIKVTHCN